MTSKVVVYGVDAQNDHLLNPLIVDQAGFIIVHVDALGTGVEDFFEGLHAVQVPLSDSSLSLSDMPFYPGNIAVVDAPQNSAAGATVLSSSLHTYNKGSLSIATEIAITGVYSVVANVQFWFGPNKWKTVLTGVAVTATPADTLAPPLVVGPGVGGIANLSYSSALAPFVRVSYACVGAGSAVITSRFILS